MTKNLHDYSKLTLKEKEIIKLIYRFRFLNRTQFQSILNHKYHSRIIAWLTKLSNDGYLVENYKRSWDNNPAIYYLGKKGAKYLIDVENIQNKYLRFIYEEEKLSFATINHVLEAANFYLKLRDYAKSKGHSIDYFTETDLEKEDYKYLLKLDAYFKYITKKGSADSFIEIDLETEKRGTFKKKLTRYLNYYYSDKWKKHFKEYPVIGIVTKTQSRLQTLLIDIEGQLTKFGNPPVEFKLTTFDLINTQGIGNDIWNIPFSKRLDRLI